MNKILFLVIALILSACTPQVTVTSEVTVTLPPSTPIPTPTLHPDFIALQNFIDASSNRFSLLPDGTIEELTVDGGQQSVPNLHVDQNGIINIIFNNEHVVIDQSQINFDDENGLTIEGYELENGEWVEGASEAMQTATALLDQYGIDPETVTLVEEGSVVNVTDNETGKVIIRSNGIQSWYGLEFAADTIAANSCESTPFKPTQLGLMHAEYAPVFFEGMDKIMEELNYPRTNGARHTILLIDRENQCWGLLYNNKDLLYRDNDGVAQKLQIIALTKEEIETFQTSR